MLDSQGTIDRVEAHAKVCANPRFYIWVVFRLSRNSTYDEVQQAFQRCASQTGVEARKAQAHASAFYNGAPAPDYVLQCCSAAYATQ